MRPRSPDVDTTNAISLRRYTFEVKGKFAGGYFFMQSGAAKGPGPGSAAGDPRRPPGTPDPHYIRSASRRSVSSSTNASVSAKNSSVSRRYGGWSCAMELSRTISCITPTVSSA